MRERNPKANTFNLPNGYIDLGWQIHDEHPSWPKIKACRKAEHKTKEFDNSLYRFRCTDVVTICENCKHVYHTDMSD